MSIKSAEFPVEEYFRKIRVYSAAMSPSGGKISYVSNLTGRPQVWVADIPSSGLLPYPKPLTCDQNQLPYVFDNPMRWIGEDKLAVMSDTDGDEKTFIEIYDLESGAVTQIPRVEGSSDYIAFVDSKKQNLYFTSNRKHPKFRGLYLYSLKSKKVREIKNPEGETLQWYENKKFKGQYFFSKFHSISHYGLYSIDPISKKITKIFDEENTVISPIRALGAGKILVNSDFEREFNTPGILDVKKGKIGWLFPDRWDKRAYLTKDKTSLMVVENKGGKEEASLYSWPTLKKKRFTFYSKGIISEVVLSRTSDWALLSSESPVNPTSYFKVSLKNTVRNRIQNLMDNYTSQVPRKTLQHPKLVKYPSQGDKVYSWLFLPPGAKQNSSLPLIFTPHGGPNSQEVARQRPVYQYFLSQGFAVWAPNHTGSTGFGKTWKNAIHRNWGDVDLADLVNGVNWLKESGWVNPEKLVIMGGSYGGYMTLRAITRHPEIFKVAVDIFGVSNLLTFCDSVPEDWKPAMKSFVGDPVEDEQMLRSQSPVFELGNVSCPLLIVQGAKDPRVVKAESDQVVEQLRLRNHPVEYLVFNDEGHGFSKRENELEAYRTITDFISKNL